MKIIAMQIVQMDDIRLDGIHPPEQFPRTGHGSIAMQPRHPGEEQIVEMIFADSPYFEIVRILGRALAIRNRTRMPFSPDPLRQVSDDMARTPAIDD